MVIKLYPTQNYIQPIVGGTVKITVTAVHFTPSLRQEVFISFGGYYQITSFKNLSFTIENTSNYNNAPPGSIITPTGILIPPDPLTPFQNVNVVDSVLPNNAATETTLEDLDTKFNLGQKNMANSIPVAIASDQNLSLSGTFSDASVGLDGYFTPTSSTLIGGSDGTYLQSAKVFDLDYSSSNEYNLGVSIRLAGNGGSVAGGLVGNPLRTDPTGTTTQPVSIDGYIAISNFPKSSTSNVTSVAASISNSTLLIANTNRIGATFWNDSFSSMLYLKLGAVASLTSYTTKILPSGYYEIPYGYIGIIDGIWNAASGSCRISELLE